MVDGAVGHSFKKVTIPGPSQPTLVKFGSEVSEGKI
jgi:hypothetical protein